MLGVNESYVFFAESQPGPFGSIGARVTPYHSVATDKSIFPRGGPVVPSTRIPTQAGQGDKLRSARTSGFTSTRTPEARSAPQAAATSTWAIGDEAERVAGYTYSEGKLFYLFIKPNPLRP